jgi:hypothetical protein
MNSGRTRGQPAVGIECGAKQQAQIKHMKRNQLTRDDTAFGEPGPHLGQMVGDGQVSGAGLRQRLSSFWFLASLPKAWHQSHTINWRTRY